MKIGILYPRSNAHPSIGSDFLDGIKIFLKQKGLDDNSVRLFSESAGFGGAEKEVYEKAEKLLVVEDVDLLIAYIDLRVSSLLEPLIYSSGKLMIIVNAGANYPHNWIAQPGIIHLSLQHSFLCRLTGLLAAQQANKKAAVSSSFYDCGYLHTAAIVNGFTRAGGSIMFNYINKKRSTEEYDIKELLAFLSSDQGKETKNLLCVLDSVPASRFYQHLDVYEDSASLKVFVSPMMLEEKALENNGNGYKFSIEGHLPWLHSLGHKSNVEFIQYFEQHTKKKASLFSLQGWEAGMIIENILNRHKNDARNATAIVDGLSSMNMTSPRGELKFDARTHFFLAPVYKCHLAPSSTRLEIMPLDWMENEWKTFSGESIQGHTSGWTNTYLCY
jgi:branched-chain amino acid transport system substrate-binding protein